MSATGLEPEPLMLERDELVLQAAPVQHMLVAAPAPSGEEPHNGRRRSEHGDASCRA